MAREEGERVMVVQDASRKFSSSAAMGIGGILRGFSLKPGDQIKLVAVLHQVHNPGMFAFMEAPLLGHKQRVDPSSMMGVNEGMVRKESAKKLHEFANNERILDIWKLSEFKKIKFKIEIHAGPSPKKVALQVAQTYKPTWIILDRHMKKEKKSFVKKTSCKISGIKRDGTVKEVRGGLDLELVTKEDDKSTSSPSPSPSPQFSYAEMLPGSSDDQLSPSRKITESEVSETQQWLHSTTKPSLSSTVKLKESPSPTLQFQQDINSQIASAYSSSNGDLSSPPFSISEDFKIPACSVCRHRRPNVRCKRNFTFAELHAATNGFSDLNFLSEGGFGSVYSGVIDGIRIAVKQHKLASSQGEKEFRSEVNVLSKVRHENLVVLLGTCKEAANHRLLLVYEYVCNGSLEKYLSRAASRPLSWDQRMKIARGVARGLQYLHKKDIIHRDMRPNNILLTHDFETRLGDFGLARTQDEYSAETRVVGTLGYLAPEYAEFGSASTKIDVYAFGVVLLELITGFKTTDMIGEGESLVAWARPLLEERNYPDLVDPRIADAHDFYQLFWMVHVVEKCLSKDPHKRITMEKVLEYLNHVMDGDPNLADGKPSSAESYNKSSCKPFKCSSLIMR